MAILAREPDADHYSLTIGRSDDAVRRLTVTADGRARCMGKPTGADVSDYPVVGGGMC